MGLDPISILIRSHLLYTKSKEYIVEFDQLDLQKALKILDTLPQTPQVKLQKQEIQKRINKITDTTIKELLSKHEIKKEELKPTLKEEPTPTKEPQTTPTPCKNLVVSTPKDNTYTTYHNNTNKVNLGKLSEREANLLFAIFQKLKDQGNTLIRFEPQDLKRMLNIDISNERLSEVVIKLWDSIKTADFWKISETETSIIQENYMLFSRCKIELNKPSKDLKYLEIQLNDNYQYLLNNLGMGQYTSFNLLEFQRVRGKYAKTLYRLLKQYKSTGILSVEWSQFRELLDIPKDYEMRNIDQKVLTPSIKELNKIYPFEHLSYKKERKSHDKRKVTHIDFYFEQLPQGETKKQKQDDKQRAQRDIKLIAWDIHNQIAKRNAKATMEARFLELKTLIGYQFRHNDSGIVLQIDNTTFEKNQMFLHVSYPKSKHNPQKFLVSNKTFALELLYVNGYSLKKDMLEIDPPSIHPITNEPIKEFAQYIGKTINITNFNVDQCPEGINNYLKITRIVKLNDNRICISVQDVDKPEKLLKPFIAKDEKHLKNWFKKHYR
nr:replication initiation protein [Helicobacter pylori]